MAKRYLIVGGGQTACSAAAKLRESDAGCDITLVSEENTLPYQKPPLSKKYMTGELDLERLLLRPKDWYVSNRIETLLGSAVQSIDRQTRTVSIANGQARAYDKLLIATGSRPRGLPEEVGGNLDGVFTIRNLTDADLLKPRLIEGTRALVIGGGYIGLEAAAVLATLGLKVTVLEMADRILQRVAGPQTSDFMRELHQGHGVEIREATGMQKLTDIDGRVSGAILLDGTRIEADIVLVGIGVVPNSELADECGIICSNGIRVNSYCETSDPDIYAAGDCTNFDFRGNAIRLESVQNAIDQAECAATNMSGTPTPYDPMPWFWSDQYDLKLQIAGLNTGYDETVVRPGTREGSQSVWYFRGDQFISVDAMNDSRAYMVGKRLLESGANITRHQASDTELELKTLLKPAR